ncbi:MAG: DUF4954 family protein, partial [Bacteroidota bacterium]|nr:DUF4954 family protein [Bacteroidota bacterium]
AFYGVKAVRFVMASHSQLKYGARLINSYLGNNSTISCCEVLNSLIFPAHEQHHNNSFLTAATVMGQSNIAAGATIGSNHNSRSADGELMAGRGFWPGLCVSLKHNTKFATFAIVAKGDYPAELNIPIPFALISNDVTNNRLAIMPGYWFMYNMYALERNGWKYADRDKRQEKIQHLENNYLAPDSVNEMVEALKLFQQFTGKAWFKREASDNEFTDTEAAAKGKQLLEEGNAVVNELEILAEGFENTKRKVVLIKVLAAYRLFKELIQYHCANELIALIEEKQLAGFEELVSALPVKYALNEWMNVGGQLIPRAEIDNLTKKIKGGKIKSWDGLHDFYRQQSQLYNGQKLNHALAACHETTGFRIANINIELFKTLIRSAVATKVWMANSIYESRAKDYTNAFRKMPFENQKEMDAVVGRLEDNTFISQQREELDNYKKQVEKYLSWK